ncbi:MAG: DUF368 domain-containing protein [Chloroflexota bacterium]
MATKDLMLPATITGGRDDTLWHVVMNFLRGLLMGGADVIPGVSGGTVALVLGIYRRLLASISSAAGVVLALAARRPDRARAAWAAIEWSLVLPLAAGIGSAIVVGSQLIPPLRHAYPVEMRALFLGLVAGSVPVPVRAIGHIGGREIAVAALAAIAAFLLVGLPPREVVSPSLGVVFLAAAVAICAMILPGISGAFLLESLGLYTPSLQAIRDRDLVYIAVFAAGAAIGIGLFARVLTWLLERHRDVTMAALVGLMVGALRALWPWLAEDRGLLLPASASDALVAIALAFVGIAAVTALIVAGSRADRYRTAG